MALLVNTKSIVSNIAPNNGIAFELEEAQALVGGYIEIINIGKGYIMIIDEEGKLDGKPFNTMATMIALHRQAIRPDDYIVGDVIICKMHEI